MEKRESFGKWFAGTGFLFAIPLGFVLGVFTFLFGCLFPDWLVAIYPYKHNFVIFLYAAAGTFGVLVSSVLVVWMSTYVAYKLSSCGRRRTK